MERPETYTSNLRCFVSSHGNIDTVDSEKWWENMIKLPDHVTITKYVPFGKCYMFTEDTIVNEKDENAICNFLQPAAAQIKSQIHQKTKYYGRKGDSFPEVYFSPDDNGNFKSSVALCNNVGGWSTLYDIDAQGGTTLSNVIELITNTTSHLEDNSIDLHILACLSTLDGSDRPILPEESSDDDDDEYDDRGFNCRSCHRDITLHEDRYWNTGRSESICQDCWDDVPGRFKQYYNYVDGDNDYCRFYNTRKGCMYGDDCVYKHVSQ